MTTTTVSVCSPLRALNVRMGGRYIAHVNNSLVIARVTAIVPSDKTHKNTRFECVNHVTGEYLPSPKRAEDLFGLTT